MSKILKFPDLHHPASYKNLKALVKDFHDVQAKDSDQHKALHDLIKKIAKVDKTFDPKLKNTKQFIKECMDLYKDRAKELKDLLKKIK